MTSAARELLQISEELTDFTETARRPDVEEPSRRLDEAATDVAKAWSGSCYGYHACVYYRDLKPPPPGAHFSKEWGLIESGMGTSGDWVEYDFDKVRDLITKRAGTPDLASAKGLASQGRSLFEEKREELLSVLQTVTEGRSDPFLERLRDEIKERKVLTSAEVIDAQKPSGTLMSRDTTALMQGLWTAPHISVLGETFGIRSPILGCEHLSKIAKRAAAHLSRLERQKQLNERIGTNVFIGHGKSSVWKDLKDFVQDRLSLPWDEFNRVPVAGVTNIARLSEMLEAAAIGLLVMTGEDDHADGSVRARMNVVHEAGLFQGRLGFSRAIVLLEEGCEEFSNIQGLGQIRFPRGNIKAVFEDVRQVLEREGLLSTA
jgi:predicted nucleotide-binding protein